MALHIQNRLAESLTRRAADRLGVSITEVIRVAMQRFLNSGPSVSGQFTELIEIHSAMLNLTAQAASLSEQLGRVLEKAEEQTRQGGNQHIRLAGGEITESEEVAPGIVLDYGEDGDVIAVEVDLEAAKCRAPSSHDQ